MTQTAQEIANAILDRQSDEVRDRMICALLQHGYGPEVIATHMAEINRVVAKIMDTQAAKVLADVMLTNCLTKTGGNA
jgi:uncharacterized protein (DUF2336 family)